MTCHSPNTWTLKSGDGLMIGGCGRGLEWATCCYVLERHLQEGLGNISPVVKEEEGKIKIINKDDNI